MKTLSEIARWMFIDVAKKPEPRTVEEVLKGKCISLQLYHEGLGTLPIVAGRFGNADMRITWNPPLVHSASGIIILANVASGDFINIKTEFNREALTKGLIELLEREDI